ncbi:MAG: 4-oxalocrotonate tautomerase DmpI [Pelovirga sp.]|jgi:4-oxalocrotonate tautomerase
MPVISLDGPRLDLDKKRALVTEITARAAQAYGLPEQTIIVMIRENEPENVAVGGLLIADR